MNSEENFCPQHGPYNAALGSCPYCGKSSSQNQNAYRPPDDEMDTEYPGSPAERPVNDEGETVMPSGGGKRLLDDQDETLPPSRKRTRRGILDEDYEDEDRTRLYEPKESKGLMGWLVVKSSQSPHYRRGKFIQIKPGAIWGRDRGRADVKVDDDFVTDLHARIMLKDDAFVIVDLQSSNGTWVNGEKIEAPKVLQQDDEIKMGNTVFVLKTLK
jgi:hypothetical protein